jgi:NADPH-dependent glutamate synthase beta subunit-like oxidoreductase/NAD(P)H-flavin reductase
VTATAASAAAWKKSTPESFPPPPPPDELVELGVPGFVYADLHEPARLAELYRVWEEGFRNADPDGFAKYDAYRACKGEGMEPLAVSEALLAAAPHVSSFVAKLFRIEAETAALVAETRSREPLWHFRKDFAKKRVLKDGAGKAFALHAQRLAEAGPERWSSEGSPKPAELAERLTGVALHAMAGSADRQADEESFVARGTLAILEIDEVARKAAKAGGAQWTDALRDRARALREALLADDETRELVRALCPAGDPPSDAEHAALVSLVLDAIEADLARRRAHKSDPAARWSSLRAPHALDHQHLVRLRRPNEKLHELFVGPENERRQRTSFRLTDKRGSVREVEAEIDYCMLCHDRDKDSCSKGLREKGGGTKKNPLGVDLRGCPLEEKISEMHALRQRGDVVGALALITVDNPMCAGTGHRICNDCMKACIFQKQEPVNIPQVETRILTEVLSLPWGMEIYGLLTRWNPLNVRRPHAKPYNGKNVLVVGLGPAGYTLAHHLACEGFAVVAVDGLKLEPLPEEWTGTLDAPPRPVKDAMRLYGRLDERILLGFGGVSEYGITVRWDKNFLTLLYMTLKRNRLIRMYGGVRFGGTLDLEDAWALGFDHVALAAGAGKPTLIGVKNDLARGMRQASDFLMGLQLTGAYKKSSLANLQVELPAIVIGGGLTAVDTATELLAYYQVQLEKLVERWDVLVAEKGEARLRKAFDEEELALLDEHLARGRALRAEHEAARRAGRAPEVQKLLDSWGGVTIVYRKNLQDSPAYRLNHEEVAKSLEEGVRYMENLSPTEAVLDARGAVAAMKFARKDGSVIELPAKTVCVAAGTRPNVTYEREHRGSLALDERGQYFQTFSARRQGEEVVLERCAPEHGFFASYAKGTRTVSFYGDNHPFYAGSVVKAMASAKDGFPHVVALFPEVATQKPEEQPAREAKLRELFATTDRELRAEVVAVNRLTKNIVEVVVRAPLAAKKFQPGQFYRLQNFESHARIVDGTRLAMEGLALTGAWTDPDKGLLGTIVLEMGGSSRLCAALRPGEPVVLMGPTGAPTEIGAKETVMLCGGGLGNAVLFSIARAFKAMGSRVLYFAGYRDGADVFKMDDIEAHTDQVIWCTDAGREIAPRRPQDAHFRGNIVQAMVAYATGGVGQAPRLFELRDVDRIIAIGSDKMMAAVARARHEALAPYLKKQHRAIGSINSPMQCMMKEVCAQCLQKHRDPETGKESVVFSCFNQDQDLDQVDFGHLAQRLRANSMQEKVASLWLDHLIAKEPGILRV